MKPTVLPALLALFLLAASCATSPAPVPADLVLRNGTIVTVDEALGTVSALAVRDGRIVAAGSDRELAAHIGERTRLIDLEGRLTLPGFIEGHGHFVGLGQSLQILDLRGARAWSDIVAQVAEAARTTPPGEWILGRGWHQEKWDETPVPSVEGFPTHSALSAVSPDHPVYLEHASGHAGLFNAKALQLAGVDSDTEDPPGGEILRDLEGAPIGVFRETAEQLVLNVFDAARAQRAATDRERDIAAAARLADAECLRKGITSFQDAGTSLETLRILADMARRGELGVRLWVMVRDSNENLRRGLADALVTGLGDDHLTVRALKRTLDGALGSRGAWLLEPYSDAPDSVGLNTATVESVEETARIAVEHDVQLCVHAIGDRANREVLDLFERALATDPELAEDHRWRIEHAQHVHPDDIPRFAQLGVIASMQAVHCTSDAPYVEARLGPERAAAGAYVWRTFLDSGALIVNGTDTPVEDVDPLPCFHAAVSRRLQDGSRFHPEQVMTRMEALRSYTLDAARAAFEEADKGSLTPGKLADIVVLSDNILEIPLARIPETRVLMTIVGGEIRWSAD